LPPQALGDFGGAVRLVLRSLPVGERYEGSRRGSRVALHDADGEIIDANAALANMVGANRDELIGRDVSAVLPEASPDLPHDVQADAEAPTKAEIAHENETIPVEIEDREVTVGGEPVHVRAVRDISKRKEWENEILLAKQEAEQQDVSL